jgi:hypothetical protein
MINPPSNDRPKAIPSGSPVAKSRSDAGNTVPRIAIVPTVEIRASRGNRIRTSKAASCTTQVNGSTIGGHVAANRPHPLTSPASQPAPRATGAQPMTARPIRATPVG